MHALGFITKFDHWITYHLKVRQREKRISSRVSLLSHSNREPFKKWIFANDEKLVLTECETSKDHLLNVWMLKTPKKRTRFQKCFAQCMIWSEWNNQRGGPCTKPNNQCRLLLQQLDKLRAKFMFKWSALINVRGFLFYNDKAQLHFSLSTR